MLAANPELETRPRLALRSAAISISSPTPSKSALTNGSFA